MFYGYFVITEEVSNAAKLIDWVGQVAYIWEIWIKIVDYLKGRESKA
jgi:hypothetical protein